jgi:glyoxylase I family protein
MDASLAFYRDGLGLSELVDREFDGPWPELFGVDSSRLRAIILVDPDRPQIGQVELLTMTDPVPDGPSPTPPATGTILLSFQVELAAVLPALETAGASDVRRSTLRNGVAVVTMRDPDGILVELIDVTPPVRSDS